MSDHEHMQPLDSERPHRIIPSGTFTIRGPYEHRTFQITRPTAGWAKGRDSKQRRVLSLLTAGDPDDMRAWTAFAWVDDPEGIVDTPDGWRWVKNEPASRIWCFKSKQSGDPKAPSTWERLARGFWRAMVMGQREFVCERDGKRYAYEILAAKRCLRCGRRLTTPESIAAGWGPECRAKLLGGGV